MLKKDTQKLEKAKREKAKREKGGVIVEFAFILPILFGLCFIGYNIVRQTEIQIVKRNISHTLASAYACSFQPKDGIDYAEICFKNVFKILLRKKMLMGKLLM